MEWSFKDVPNTAVLTTKDIMKKKSQILFVSHDSDDGMWQFLDGEESDFDKVLLVGLKEIVEIDSSINSVADLPLGWIAWRKNINDSWIKEKDDEE